MSVLKIGEVGESVLVAKPDHQLIRGGDVRDTPEHGSPFIVGLPQFRSSCFHIIQGSGRFGDSRFGKRIFIVVEQDRRCVEGHSEDLALIGY